MSKNNFDLFDEETGAFKRHNSEEIVKLERQANQIKAEFSKVSKHKYLGQSIEGFLEIDIYILDDTDNPKYALHVYGKEKDEVEKAIKQAIDDFIISSHYAFHKYHNQLKMQFSHTVKDYLNNLGSESEFWCSPVGISTTLLNANTNYSFYIIKFNKSRLDNEFTFNGTRHPFIDEIRNEWEYRFGNSTREKICYNELFRRASSREYFLYHFQDDINALSAMKYENEINRGSIIALEKYQDESFEKKVKNYNISLRLSIPIKIIPENYKKLRKLLEIARDGLSLLMNDQDEIFAIGKMKKRPSSNYYMVCFTNFLEWKFFKNGEEYLCFSNMLPAFPEKETGLQQKDIELLIKTFGESHLSILKKIIQTATKQQHGTMVVFAENAKEEIIRLKASGIQIRPKIVSPNLVKAATSIDGALICDENGICYAIGTILDGEASDMADSSRGARFNSAIRYIEKQKAINKKTFIVIVSEDKYVDCLSTTN